MSVSVRVIVVIVSVNNNECAGSACVSATQPSKDKTAKTKKQKSSKNTKSKTEEKRGKQESKCPLAFDLRKRNNRKCSRCSNLASLESPHFKPITTTATNEFNFLV